MRNKNSRLRKLCQYLAISFLFLAAFPSIVESGVFIGTAACSNSADCQPLDFVSDPNYTIPPFAITHPPGYDGSGGELRIRICLADGAESLKRPLERAIDTWNALLPTLGNCTGCKVWEDTPDGLTIAHAETTLLHELGHCPLGLDHPDRNWDPQPDGFWELTSYTRSSDVLSPPDGIAVGPDFIRGTLDDIQRAGGGMIPESVHWFRITDNNPFVIDNTVIDKDTYSRSIVADLPSGHSWAANANRRVGESLGIMNTQAVMYSRQAEGEQKTKLSADDVAMIQMAMTGQDLEAGTADDYRVELELVSPCEDPFDILVTFGPTPIDTAAFCEGGVDFSFPQNPFLARHVTLVAPAPGEPFFIVLNEEIDWDLGPEIFTSGFETGTTSEWSSSSAAPF